MRLPSYLPANPTAHIEYRKRLIAWTLTEPGELHRNRYQWAHITVHEQTPWRGEPLSVRAERRTSTTSYARESFTDAARQKMHAEIVPVVARYGFDRMWTELSRNVSAFRSAHAARAEAVEARRTAEWWDLKAELIEMHEMGAVEFVPVDDDSARHGRRRVTVRVAHPHQQRFSHEHPAARVMCESDQVGWVLDSGELVPMDGVIR